MDRKYVIDAIAQIVGGPQRVQTAELIVERLTEEGVLHLGYGDADVDRVVQAFTDTFGTTKTTKTDRYAAARMVKKYGAPSVVGLIRLLKHYEDQPFVPVTNDLRQLESKMVSILAFARKQNDVTIL